MLSCVPRHWGGCSTVENGRCREVVWVLSQSVHVWLLGACMVLLLRLSWYFIFGVGRLWWGVVVGCRVCVCICVHAVHYIKIHAPICFHAHPHTQSYQHPHQHPHQHTHTNTPTPTHPHQHTHTQEQNEAGEVIGGWGWLPMYVDFEISPGDYRNPNKFKVCVLLCMLLCMCGCEGIVVWVLLSVGG